MGPIFINDDGEFITASIKQLGRIEIFIHKAGAGFNIITALRGLQINQERSWRNSKSSFRTVQVGFYVDSESQVVTVCSYEADRIGSPPTVRVRKVTSSSRCVA